MIKSIKTQLFAIFLLLGLMSFAIFYLTNKYINDKESEILSINQNINKIHTLILTDIKITRDFFSNETINSDYFNTGKSAYLDSHYYLCTKIEGLLYVLKNSSNTEASHPDYNTEISHQFIRYKKMFDSIVYLITVRGFKDANLEGRMRSLAHKLENNSARLGLANILLLRKHEKDFIIRQDASYKRKFHDQVDIILAELDRTKTQMEPDLIKDLLNYESKFDSIVYYDKLIGLKNQSGLKKNIDHQADILIDGLQKTSAITLQQANAEIENIHLVFIFLWLSLLSLAILFALLLSKNITRAINALKQNISDFIDSDFNEQTIKYSEKAGSEIAILTNQFNILQRHIINQMRSYKVKNKELEMFIIRASRDVKTPLLMIIQSHKQLAKETTDLTLQNELTLAFETLESINETIDELSIVISLSKTNIELNEINTSDLINKCIMGLKSYPGFEHIVFRKSIHMRNIFYSDIKLVKIILRNIMENSIKFQNHKVTTRYIDIAFDEIENKMVKISIKDNGIGIEDKNMVTIFDLLSKHEGKNNGAGLYIVQKVIEKLKGAAKINSRTGEGTEFIIYLPDASKKTNQAQRIIENQTIFPYREDLVLDYL